MATDVNHGAECAAGGICILGMVAEIEARMEPIRLGDGVPDRLLFRDDFCFPSRMIAARPFLREPGAPGSRPSFGR